MTERKYICLCACVHCKRYFRRADIKKQNLYPANYIKKKKEKRKEKKERKTELNTTTCRLCDVCSNTQ